MSGHPRVIGYLQRAVSHELNAAQQLTLQAVQAEMLGLLPLAAELRQGMQEEILHAEDFIRRMMQLGAAPRTGSTGGFPIGRSHGEILRFGLATEAAAIRLYREACEYCERSGDQDNYSLFARILEDERQHYQSIERALQALGSRHAA